MKADFQVSVPKIETQHLSGVTVSMKNLFGVVPGTRISERKTQVAASAGIGTRTAEDGIEILSST